jgi:uncharacterized protein DUF4242
MELVLVERHFASPVDFASIQALEDAGAWCLQAHQVTFLKTFFARDRKRMLCLYEAPDAESVRVAAGKAGVPFERAWACEKIVGDAAGVAVGQREHVMVERRFPQPITPEDVRRIEASSAWCLDVNDASRLESYLSRDGQTLVCLFLAPDLEALRRVGRMLELPDAILWSTTLHLPPA